MGQESAKIGARTLPTAIVSLQSVHAYLDAHAPDLTIIEAPTSTATVALAAAAHGVAPGQIAKTLSLWLGDAVILLVMAGDARLDNRKFKDRFGCKPRMLDAQEVLHWTSHPVGGVCPFGLPQALPIYTDVSLQRFETVIPAAGAVNAALRIRLERLVTLTAATWVDVAQATAEAPPADGLSSVPAPSSPS